MVSSESSIKSLWQQQTIEPVRSTLSDVSKRAMSYQRKIHIRNAFEYISATCVVIVFGKWLIDRHDQLTAVLMCTFIIAAALFTVTYLRRKGYATTPPTAGDTRTYLNYLIRDLTRQRDLLRNIFWWYLAPYVPGLAMALVDRLVHHSASSAISIRVWIVIYLVFVLAVFICGYALNQRAARRLQSCIDKAEATLRSFDDAVHK